MRPLFFLSLLLLSMPAFSQVGIGTEHPNARAVLDLRSPTFNQGFLAPRLTTVQRTAPEFTSGLTAAENGLLVFDTDDKLFYYWIFPEWRAVEAGTSATVWRSGSGAPQDTQGEENDYYLDLASGDVYQKQAGSYTVIGNLKGPKGEKGDKGDKGDPGEKGDQGD